MQSGLARGIVLAIELAPRDPALPARLSQASGKLATTAGTFQLPVAALAPDPQI